MMHLVLQDGMPPTCNVKTKSHKLNRARRMTLVATLTKRETLPGCHTSHPRTIRSASHSRYFYIGFKNYVSQNGTFLL